MKTFRMTTTLVVTDDCYENNKSIRDLKNEVLSGSLQREIINPEKGIMDVKITFEQINKN